MEIESTAEMLTTVRMSITVAGFEVDARLFGPSLPTPESVVVTSHTGKSKSYCETFLRILQPLLCYFSNGFFYFRRRIRVCNY